MKGVKTICMLFAVLLLCTCTGTAYAADASEEQGQRQVYEDTMFPENRNHDNERIIQSVDSGAVVNPATVAQRMGPYDIATRLALVFTIVSVIALWVLHTIKNRKDPMRKFKL